ncbi:signal transduction histidine kinase [Constrictibacter sp. MBR-5]|jgi:signal transduction histidine kinase
MMFPAQTRADLQALALCGRPVLVITASDSAGPMQLFANATAANALIGATAGDGAWNALDEAAIRRFGSDARHFAAPYPRGAVSFDVSADGVSGGIAWRVAAWPLSSSDEAPCIVAVATDAQPAADLRPTEPAILEAIEQSVGSGHIWSDPASGCQVVSDGALRLWGLPGTTSQRTLGDFLAVVNPDDIRDVLDCEATTGEIQSEFRIIGPSGKMHYVMRHSRCMDDGTGRPKILHIDRDVTAARTLERELIQTRSEAEVGARSKAEFLSLMSHELRTPLNAVMGFSQVMSAEMFGPLAPRYLDYAREIGRSAEHLLTIINDILDLTRIEAARVQISKEWLDLGRLAAETTKMMSETARRKDVTIEIDVNAAVRAWGEKRALRQLTLNLVSNAVKFTEAGGTVIVSVRRSDAGAAILTVKDNGIGIPEDDLPTIFQPFVQASNAMGRAEAGTGLGLAIVRALVDLHDGEVTVQSELGAGTTVTVTIPPAFDHTSDDPIESGADQPSAGAAALGTTATDRPTSAGPA